MIKLLTSREGVCVRPVLRRVTDRATGEWVVRALDCGSTLETRCPACAAKACRLRIRQCTEGRHLDEEPEISHATAGAVVARESEDRAEDDLGQPDDQADDVGVGSRRVRATRRLKGMPELPQQPVAERTVGTVFTAPDGKAYRPSMFVTLTLDSYGRSQDRPDLGGEPGRAGEAAEDVADQSGR